MSGSIKPGDLAMVVRGHGCDLGRVFTVGSIEQWPWGWHCPVCGTRTSAPYTAAATAGDVNDAPDITWLKRIPPLSELDDVKRDEEITA